MSFNVVVGVPSYGSCKICFAHSLARMTAYFAQNPVYPCEEQRLEFMFLEGSGISSNRENIAKQALELDQMTHLLFIDEDMGWNPDTLHILAKTRQPLVGCNYRMRAPPADFTAFKSEKEGRVQTLPSSTGLEKCEYTGFGFSLIAREVLEAIKIPRFPIWFNTDAECYTTEDAPFYKQCKEAGFQPYVDHDASKGIWHSGGINYVFNEDYSNLSKGFRGPIREQQV